jgi:hypothetical protein
MDKLNWEERPFVSLEQMGSYSARDRETALKYGPVVKAAEITNRDYNYRYGKFGSTRKMKPPPSSHIHIYLGYLVVRRLGTPDQYETWMPDVVFDELYEATREP